MFRIKWLRPVSVVTLFFFVFFIGLHKYLNPAHPFMRKLAFHFVIGQSLIIAFRSFFLILLLYFPASSLIEAPPLLLRLLPSALFLYMSALSVLFFRELYHMPDYSNLIQAEAKP